MTNWFKRFWFDLGKLQKHEWGIKYILPIFAFFTTWGFAGHLYLSNISKSKLIPIKGVVKSISIKLEKGYKRNKYYPIKIVLHGTSDEYRVMDKFKSYFSVIKSEIHVDDSVTLYIRKKWQYLLSWGQKKDILIIEKSNNTVFPALAYRRDAQKLWVFLALLSSLLWTLYYLYKRKVILKKRFEYSKKNS